MTDNKELRELEYFMKEATNKYGIYFEKEDKDGWDERLFTQEEIEKALTQARKEARQEGRKEAIDWVKKIGKREGEGCHIINVLWELEDRLTEGKEKEE